MDLFEDKNRQPLGLQGLAFPDDRRGNDRSHEHDNGVLPRSKNDIGGEEYP